MKSVSASAVPYILLGDSRRRALVDRITAAIERWQSGWIPHETAPVHVEVQEARHQPVDIRVHESGCFRVSVAQENVLSLLVPPRSLSCIVGAPAMAFDASSVFADDKSLAALLEREALRRFACALLGVEEASADETLVLERTSSSATELLREHGAERFISASIVLGGGRCALTALLAPAIVAALLPQRHAATDEERIERRRTTVAAESVAVDVILGNAEVSLSELASLAVGDVIVLEQGLAEVAGLAVRGGERISGVALGRVESQRAIQVKGRTA